MGRREQAREEARFLRGDVGVDGQATDANEADAAEKEQITAREALLRGRTWLGREALTWLLWRSESTEPLVTFNGKPLSVVFTGKLVLRSGAGELTEVAVKGAAAPYASLVKQALDQGLLVHTARLSLQHEDQTYEVTVDAEFFDVRSAKLPALLGEDEAERLTERLELAGRLSSMLDELLKAFMEVRSARGWNKTVGEMRTWISGSSKTRASKR